MIRLLSVDKCYGPVAALQSASLAIAPGERVAIVGPSGSGKTTLLRLLAGLERPDAGEIYLHGRLVSTPRQLAPPYERGIGYAFQAPTLCPHMTAAQNVAFGLSDLTRAERAQRVEGLLAAMDLRGLAHRYPEQLSGGEARRVSLARALAPRPRYLLLDEPLTNLDPALKAMLGELLCAQLADTGATLLYVTHDETEVALVATRVIRMANGSIEPASASHE